jgi:hypothetical protein
MAIASTRKKRVPKKARKRGDKRSGLMGESRRVLEVDGRQG